jgi:hypothetical protein
MSALATEVRIPFRWCCCSGQSYCLVRRCKVPKRAAALARLRCRKDARRSAHRSPIRGQATSWLGPGDVDAGDDHQVIASGGQWCGLGFCTRRGDAPTHSQCLRFRMRRHHAHGFPPLLSRIPVALLPLITRSCRSNASSSAGTKLASGRASPFARLLPRLTQVPMETRPFRRPTDHRWPAAHPPPGVLHVPGTACRACWRAGQPEVTA